MAQDNTGKNKTHPSHQVEDQIRQRAYELYETRGREDGHDLEDWIRAESEIAGGDTQRRAA